MEQQEQAATNHQQTNAAQSFGDAANGQSADQRDDRELMEQFLANPAHDYRNLQYGDTVDGIIMRVGRDEILVDIGAKAEGVVPAREMQSLSDDDRAALKPGDPLLVFVVQSEDKEGRATLSIDRARQEKSWRRLQQCYETGEIIEAKVINYNKGGLLVNLDGVRGFVPSSQVSGIGRGSEAQKQSEMARMVGQTLALKVIEINRNRNRLILSERQAAMDVREGRKGELLSALKEGDVREGVVTSVCDFGAFVDIGGADGLVHLSELSWSRVKHPSEILKPGDKVQVYVLSIDNERKRIALSLKRTQHEPWATVGERYHIGQMVEGVVTQLAPFGAFVRIEDGVEGLIHVSEMGDGRVQHPRDVLQEGDAVQARIIRIDPARKRIGLSMRQSSDDQIAHQSSDKEEESDADE
ncbi:30S ribosomal protein S1 [Roseiflexus castenholzii]|jgi:small subunit ribosomal protein S1|uniref:RNA binding S1 domain protein n=1 Tax=Roseiflexus castenholzii (strain DSM 13941 / HLO8) TaxID=383372 RepID=A7NKT3_ROSCS|nr:30S ribosomal protein S1 [Roseiflexus castenholzii]ABU58103.1 RNA binding S1 domain protein [Roseiflexus castenholzii DSM 13941]